MMNAYADMTDKLTEIEARLADGYVADAILDDMSGQVYPCYEAADDVRWLIDEVKRLRRIEHEAYIVLKRAKQVEPNLYSIELEDITSRWYAMGLHEAAQHLRFGIEQRPDSENKS